MTANYLKLNDNKTKITVISKDLYQEISSVKVGDAQIVPSDSVKNLGVFFDTDVHVSMDTHVNL